MTTDYPATLRRPRLCFLLLCAVVVGLVATAWIWRYREDNAPLPATFRGLVVEARPSGGYWLKVSYTTPSMAHCLRQSLHLLYYDEPNGKRMYYQLGAAMNGAGLQGTRPAYDLLFGLPPDFPRAPWAYIMRTYYSCAPFQMAHWGYTSEPIPVPFPPPDQSPKEPK